MAGSGAWGYLGLLGLAGAESAAFLGLAVPGEAFVLAAGALAARGVLSLPWAVAAVVAGAIVGDSVGYALGRHFGECREHHWLSKVWSCQRMGRVRLLLDRRGREAIFLGRFIGLLRPLVPFAAGAVQMPYRRFLSYSVAGGLAWGTTTVLAGYFLGNSLEKFPPSAGVWVVALGAIAVLLSRRRRRSAPRGSADVGAGSQQAGTPKAGSGAS